MSNYQQPPSMLRGSKQEGFSPFDMKNVKNDNDSKDDNWVTAPRWSQGLWGSGSHQTIPHNNKKTFRSLSFSSASQTGNNDQKPGSHMLDTFNEEESTDDDIIDRLSSTTIDENRFTTTTTLNDSNTFLQQQQQQHPPPPPAVQQQPGPIGQGLWFNENTNNSNARRHSYAGEHIQLPSSATTATTISPPTSPNDKHNRVNPDIDRYFTSDELGRNCMDYDYSDIRLSEAAALISVPSRKLYFVEFKSARIDVFYIPENSNLVARVNDLVIVDADRGRDLGKVVNDHVSPEQAGCLKLKRHQEQQAILQHNPQSTAATATSSGGGTPGVTMPKQILRFAQPNEIQQILSKEQDEKKAVAMCLQKVNEKGLEMTVLDAEYQWDRRKLTFFYSANHRIDFRDLVRDLFRVYKTRIWMCAVNISNVTAQPKEHSPSGPTVATTTATSTTTTGEYGLFNTTSPTTYSAVAASALAGPPPSTSSTTSQPPVSATHPPPPPPPPPPPHPHPHPHPPAQAQIPPGPPPPPGVMPPHPGNAASMPPPPPPPPAMPPIPQGTLPHPLPPPPPPGVPTQQQQQQQQQQQRYQSQLFSDVWSMHPQYRNEQQYWYY